MPMTKAQCAQIRVAINRAYDGPPMMHETLSDPAQQVVLRQLQADVRTWLGMQIIAHLQNILPPNERVRR